MFAALLHAKNNLKYYTAQKGLMEEMSVYELKTEAAFDGAHFLSDYEGKCENLHGHRWRVVAWIGAEALQDEGQERDMVCDFATFKRVLRELAMRFDHTFIVEEGTLAPETVAALQAETFRLTFVPWRTTAENFARHFFCELAEAGFAPTRVEVYETPNNCAIYLGE